MNFSDDGYMADKKGFIFFQRLGTFSAVRLSIATAEHAKCNNVNKKGESDEKGFDCRG
jgi:hypothetical protein